MQLSCSGSLSTDTNSLLERRNQEEEHQIQRRPCFMREALLLVLLAFSVRSCVHCLCIWLDVRLYS
jgi:hypothetical protein